ncbi:MAG: prepilin-type N-terminal cleavage/methylation domain-containing protein [Gemmatimonadota bacterium]|jgi:prepilin-type N-terminal cleavage/methylation domain-containing protein
MRRPRTGFTLMELMFVLLIAAVILSIGMKQFGRLQVRHQVGNARDALVYMAVRAQSEAMKRGDLVRFEIWPDTNMAKIVTPSDSAIERVRFDSQYGVRVLGVPITACYSSRGFALPSCTTTGLPRRVWFVASSDTAKAVVLPLGQVERLR